MSHYLEMVNDKNDKSTQAGPLCEVLGTALTQHWGFLDLVRSLTAGFDGHKEVLKQVSSEDNMAPVVYIRQISPRNYFLVAEMGLYRDTYALSPLQLWLV